MISHSAFAQMNKRLDSIITVSIQAGEPGIALYVETGGKKLYKNGFGLADVPNNRNINEKTSIVYFSNIAGNSGPFRKILRILSEEGISNLAEVFQLHELTR